MVSHRFSVQPNRSIRPYAFKKEIETLSCRLLLDCKCFAVPSVSELIATEQASISTVLVPAMRYIHRFPIAVLYKRCLLKTLITERVPLVHNSLPTCVQRHHLTWLSRKNGIDTYKKYKNMEDYTMH